MTRGLVIYFDGPDGAGKTTQLQLVADTLQHQGCTVHITRALGGTPIGEQLRSVALSDVDRPVQVDLHIAMACHYALAPGLLERRDHGEIVLIDRSPLSIIGYQVLGDGLDMHRGYEYATELFELVRPDATILYNAADDTLQARRKARDGEGSINYFEDKPAAYHQRVADGLEQAAEHFGATVVSAMGTPDEVHQATMQVITPLLEA